MTTRVAEYLGIDVEKYPDVIEPVKKTDDVKSYPCPFRNGNCSKFSQGTKPICSVRDGNDNLWIVCENRFCATTPKDSDLNAYQVGILHKVAQKIYGDTIPQSDVLVKREETIPVTRKTDTKRGTGYSADFIMWRHNPNYKNLVNPDRPVVLEMQGGGETSGTEKLTKVVKEWEKASNRTNEMLMKSSGANPLVTNAWRRQQEQFLVKGNVATMSGGKMVFCVGELLFDYLQTRIREGVLLDLSKEGQWTLALIAIEEKDASDLEAIRSGNSVPIGIKTEKIIYTNYVTFVQALINQSEPCSTVFCGDYTSLLNEKVNYEC